MAVGLSNCCKGGKNIKMKRKMKISFGHLVLRSFPNVVPLVDLVVLAICLIANYLIVLALFPVTFIFGKGEIV